ncbi:MAG: hypothetical protein J6Y59_05075 [Bacteroidaceae bacterium]|nr:hypothetical protein [Bacteroidaceae bacterium]
MKRNISFLIISLMTFCVFAQDLYIGSFYVTTTEEETLYGDGGDKWTNRKNVICNMFKYEQPDVLGLQSLTESQLSSISTLMTYHNAAGDILYSKELELDSCGVVSDMPEGSTCSWAKLKKEGKAFYVFNIHFSTVVSVAYSSATRLRTAIEEVNTEGLPCFIVGNLGVDSSKTAYTRITGKYFDSFTKASVVSAEYGTRNNFDLAANHGSERYDFVFVSRNVTVKAYGQLQNAYYTAESGGSYKRRFPSTHFPVMAKVTLP